MTASWLAQARALVRRDLLIDIRYRLAFFIGLGDAVLILVSYSFLSHVFGTSPPDGYPPLAFVLVGVAFTDSLTTAVVCLALGVRYGQQTGTVKVLLAEPVTPVRLMTLSLVYPLLRAAIDFVAFLVVAVALGVPARGMHAGSIGLVFVGGVAAVSGIGIASAAAALIFKRGDPVLWALGTATALLSGVLYPTSVLPDALRLVSAWLPTTHALAAMRAAVIGGASPWAIRQELAVLAAFAVGGIALGLWLFDAAARHARREGTLGQL